MGATRSNEIDLFDFKLDLLKQAKRDMDEASDCVIMDPQSAKARLERAYLALQLHESLVLEGVETEADEPAETPMAVTRVTPKGRACNSVAVESASEGANRR